MTNYNGTIIKKIRLNMGLTQEELAYNICSIKQITRIESNTSNPIPFMLNYISRKLGNELFDFLPYSDDKNAFELKRDIDFMMDLYRNFKFNQVLHFINNSCCISNTNNIQAIFERKWILVQ